LEVFENAPEEVMPKKLAFFVDGWIPGFEYRGDHSPQAIFCCEDRLTSWGIVWTTLNDKSVTIVPSLVNGAAGHPTLGLSVLELQGIDSSTALMVVEEKLPLSNECVRYGLVLDYAKISMDICQSVVTRSHLMCRDAARPQWSPAEMKTQWDIILEDLADTNSRSMAQQTVAATPPPAPKKPRKRKSLVGAPGDDVQGEAGTSGKKKKKEETLTLHKCLALTEADLKKLTLT
jgi:hypothetical protein